MVQQQVQTTDLQPNFGFSSKKDDRDFLYSFAEDFRNRRFANGDAH